jgi:hypothetical protein
MTNLEQMLKQIPTAAGDASDAILESLGLERRRSTVGRWATDIGFFTVGVAVGVGVGILVAPKAGQELRGELLTSARQLATSLNWGGSSSRANGANDKGTKQSNRPNLGDHKHA